MHVWPVYGIAIGAVVVRSWPADRLLRMASFILLADWFAANALHWFSDFDYRPIFPRIDLALCATFAFAWVYFQKPWMMVLGALYWISSMVGWLADGHGSKYSFDLALNAAFLARLAVVWISSDEPRKAQEMT